MSSWDFISGRSPQFWQVYHCQQFRRLKEGQMKSWALEWCLNFCTHLMTSPTIITPSCFSRNASLQVLVSIIDDLSTLNSMARVKQPYLSTPLIFLIFTQSTISIVRMLAAGCSFSRSKGTYENGVTHWLMSQYTLSITLSQSCYVLLICMII